MAYSHQCTYFEGRDTPESESESASGKWGRREPPDKTKDRHRHLGERGKEDPAVPDSMVGSTGGGGAPKPLPTILMVPKQMSLSVSGNFH